MIFFRQLLEISVKEIEKNKQLLKDSNLVTDLDIEKINTYLKKTGKYKTLTQIDQHIINDFSNLNSSNRAELESKYRLNFKSNSNGTYSIDLSDEDKVQDFINTITSKRGLDFDSNVVETSVPFKRKS